MANAQLVKKLDDWGVDYEVLKHKTVYTAYDVAATLKKKLNEIAKTLIIQADKNFYFVAIPADKNLDFAKLKKAIKKAGGTVKNISIPTEKQLLSKLNIKPGKITGFGSIHKLSSVIDKDLSKGKKVVFSAGDVTESILMAVKDYLKVEEPRVEIIGQKKKFKKLKNVRTKKAKNGGTKKRKNKGTKKAKKQGTKKPTVKKKKAKRNKK